MTDTYRVTAPYATLRVRDFNGVTLRGFHRDAILPAETVQEDIDDHLGKGMVEKVDAPPVEPSVEESEPAKPAKATKATG